MTDYTKLSVQELTSLITTERTKGKRANISDMRLAQKELLKRGENGTLEKNP